MRERQEIEQVLSLEDRNEIINALLRTAEAHPMIDLRATAYGMCRAVAAVRRYDDRLTATDGLPIEAGICSKGSGDRFIGENEFANAIASMALGYANQYRKPQQ
ncbi:hypothetical protein A7P98_05545 [Eikenella sp. NML080894]|uniref:hypothetical protein n=1 Tax=Eikenella sp. NML080894 TaxID=1795830 RepID=UPI0007DE799F|nr:hypothetical protein [Eikenella sp. NML080894]OAM36024.1 hypothetical protein A7P98_05545 [Eikenella sp. NML080894]